MTLRSRYFSEPNPFNPPGNLRPADVPAPFVFDMTHDFANERLPQGSLTGLADPADFTVPAEPRPTREFLTRKLWTSGNTDPYGHRGDLTTLTEAINFHGGAARTERDAFFALPQPHRDDVIEFLKTLQVLKEGRRSRWI
jgi:cytochrome c peroxidase